MKGFTLVELLLVTIIIAVLLSAAVPHFADSFSHLALETAAGDMAETVRFAQAKAIAQERPYRLRINTESSEYQLFVRNASALQDEYERLGTSHGKPVYLPRGVRCQGVVAGDLIYSPICTLDFSPDGSVEIAGVTAGRYSGSGALGEGTTGTIIVRNERDEIHYIRLARGLLNVEVVAEESLHESSEESIVHAD